MHLSQTEISVRMNLNHNDSLCLILPAVSWDLDTANGLSQQVIQQTATFIVLIN